MCVATISEDLPLADIINNIRDIGRMLTDRPVSMSRLHELRVGSTPDI